MREGRKGEKRRRTASFRRKLSRDSPRVLRYDRPFREDQHRCLFPFAAIERRSRNARELVRKVVTVGFCSPSVSALLGREEGEGEGGGKRRRTPFARQKDEVEEGATLADDRDLADRRFEDDVDAVVVAGEVGEGPEEEPVYQG